MLVHERGIAESVCNNYVDRYNAATPPPPAGVEIPGYLPGEVAAE